MKIHFATWLEEVSQDEALTNKDAKKRLLSYYFIQKRDSPDKDFEEYMDRKWEYI